MLENLIEFIDDEISKEKDEIASIGNAIYTEEYDIDIGFANGYIAAMENIKNEIMGKYLL